MGNVLVIEFVVSAVHSAKIVTGTTSNLNKNIKTCAGRDYNHGTVVCVCNATYCDTIEPVQPEKIGKYVIYTSNKAGLRFNKKVGEFQKNKSKKTGRYNKLMRKKSLLTIIFFFFRSICNTKRKFVVSNNVRVWRCFHRFGGL